MDLPYPSKEQIKDIIAELPPCKGEARVSGSNIARHLLMLDI